MAKFNRSEYMKQVHAQARKEQQLYQQLTGKKADYNQFLKQSSPFDESIVAYDVSYQMTYMSMKNNLNISSPETYRVYALNTDNIENNIITNTTESVKNLKASSGNGFHPDTQKMIESNIKVNVSKIRTPRGIETPDGKVVYNSEIVEKVKQNGIYVESIDLPVKVEGGRRSNKNKVDMKSDITRYLE